MRGAVVIAALGLVGVGLLLVAQRFLDDLQAPAGPAPAPLLAVDEEPALPLAAKEPGQPGQPAPAPAGEAASAPSPRELALQENRRALEALQRGELEQAVRLLEGCCERDPEEAVFRRNLAVARASWAEELVDSPEPADRARALELLERALTDLDGEERAAMQARLERWRAQAQHEDDFFTSGNPRFELAYDGDHAELRAAQTDLLERLDRAYQDLGELFGAFPLERRRLRVVLQWPSALPVSSAMAWVNKNGLNCSILHRRLAISRFLKRGLATLSKSKGMRTQREVFHVSWGAMSHTVNHES